MGDISDSFSRSEFECWCGCGFSAVDVDLLAALEIVRNKFKRPVKINSACRCDEHNRNIGGADKSKHSLGIAADIVVKDVSPDEVYKYLDKMWPHTYGIGKYNSFTHIDVRKNKARW